MNNWKLSPSDFAFLYEECSRCFYLKIARDYQRPRGPFPKIFTIIDGLMNDTGIGIAPEDIPKALTRFGQVDSDLNRKYEGTGLGLPLTKALVELHGGYLDLQSQIGVGTTVTVRFPAARIVTAGANATYPSQSLEAS